MNKRQRRKKILDVYDHSSELSIYSRHYRTHVKRYVLEPMRDDLKKDITSRKLISRSQQASAKLISKQSGRLAGIAEVIWAVRKLGVTVRSHRADGKAIEHNTIVLTMHGNARTLLGVERTLVNTVQRMSGIATATAQLQNACPHPGPLIAATRKTIWGLLDKQAVVMGGGLSHRLSLQSGAMVKDNHIALLGEDTSLRNYFFSRRIQSWLEVDSLPQLKRYTEQGLAYDSIMLDNFSPQQIRKALQWLKRQHYYQDYIFEATGGITTESISAYSKTGVDVLSIGSITHSAVALDFSLEITNA